MCLTMHRGIFWLPCAIFRLKFVYWCRVCIHVIIIFANFKLICNTYKCANVIVCIAICNYRSWTWGSCVKQKYDVGLSIALLTTQPWIVEINEICLAFKLKQRDLCIVHSKPTSFSTSLDAKTAHRFLPKVKVMCKRF